MSVYGLYSQLTGRLMHRVTVPAEVLAMSTDARDFWIRNRACQDGIRGVQWLNVKRIRAER